MSRETELTPDLLLRAYSVGLFPMARSADDPSLAWFDPDPRGILPLDRFHIPRRLARTVRTTNLRVTADTAFDAVIDGCAGGGWKRPQTWINPQIRSLCLTLHRRGAAHSIEVWDGGVLVGGLYGVALRAAFFGESMFSTARDASKIALVHLVERLKQGGFVLLDTQFVTEHLMQFGAVQISRAEYRRRLADAMGREAAFQCVPAAPEASADSAPQSTTQIS
jgi:leucyl/phenylalanyl-tRNA--protein transferase